MNFMCLPDKYADKSAAYHILPIAYEKDITYGRGASKGPAAIIEASKHLEYYDEELESEPFIKGICLHNKMQLSDREPSEAIRQITEGAAKHKEKFLITLGGDHAVTIGVVKGLERLHGKFSVLILDAHSDLRDSWNNSQYNHACVAKRIVSKHKVGIIGVRSQDIDEAAFARKSDSIQIIKAYEHTQERIESLLKMLDEKLYISIDVDVFDPSFIRNTGTPEPGGLSWRQVISVLKSAFEKKNIIGCDIVEFAPEGPKENYRSEAYSLAKLCYKIIGLNEKSKSRKRTILNEDNPPR